MPELFNKMKNNDRRRRIVIIIQEINHFLNPAVMEMTLATGGENKAQVVQC
jgi:hypothetical protein